MPGSRLRGTSSPSTSISHNRVHSSQRAFQSAAESFALRTNLVDHRVYCSTMGRLRTERLVLYPQCVQPPPRLHGLVPPDYVLCRLVEFVDDQPRAGGQILKKRPPLTL